MKLSRFFLALIVFSLSLNVTAFAANVSDSAQELAEEEVINTEEDFIDETIVEEAVQAESTPIAISKEKVYSVSASKYQTFTNTLYEVGSKPIETQESLTVKGFLPYIEVAGNEAFQSEINNIVDKFRNGAVAKATEQSSRLSFSYQVFANEKHLNIALFAKYGVGKDAGEEIVTFVLAKDFCKLYSLSDILGPNAYDLASAFVYDAITYDNSHIFNSGSDFKGVKESTSFYFIDDETLGILFSKDFIGDSDTSMVFIVALEDIYQSIITKVETNRVGGVVSVPLRKVAQDLGYSVEWNDEEKSVALEKNGKSFTFYIDENDYAGVALEKAPEYIFSKVYVPVSLFSEVLGCCVNVDEASGNVVIDQF